MLLCTKHAVKNATLPRDSCKVNSEYTAFWEEILTPLLPLINTYLCEVGLSTSPVAV
jgi:hypothetical protein